MNTVTVTYFDNEDHRINEVFEDVVAHQIGGGAVQIVLHDGVQRIINNFTTVDVEPSEEDKKVALERTAQAYAPQEKEPEDPAKDKVTPIK